MRLKREKLRHDAPQHLASFLVYANSKYQIEWFHRVIADACQRLFDGEIKNLMIFVPPQHGKLLADDTPIATPNGFVRHGDLKPGDWVFGADGRPTRVIATSEKGRTQYRMRFSDGSAIDCHGRHEWVLYDKRHNRTAVFETQELFGTPLDTGTPGKRGHRYNYYVERVPTVEFAAQDVSVDPYTLGKSSAPHIPTEYIFNSIDVREQLIAGIIDTDGYVYRKNGRVTISNTNKDVVDAVALVLRSLGESPVICSYDARTSTSGIVGKQTCYQIGFNPSRRYPTAVPRKRIDRIVKPRKVALVAIERIDGTPGNCIQVDGGVYLAGERFTPTHNSEIVSRNFPAWALGRDPNIKIAGCSYSADLAEQFSLSIQRTIDSPEYQALFPGTYLNGSFGHHESQRGVRRNTDFFQTVGHAGFYKGVGVGGGLTGTPVDIAIIDDPVKDSKEALSPTIRQRVWDWYNTVLTTRLHNNSKQLFIMTRWHEDDLAGRLLKAEPDEWTVITIPAICTNEHDGALNSPRHIGDALWPEKHSLEKLEKQKNRSPRDFSAMYQQSPVIEGGNIVKRDWFRRISMADFRALRYNEPMHFYLDTAFKKKNASGHDNDPSGILAACRVNNDIYLYDAMSVWKEMPDLLRFLPDYIAAHEGNSESILHIEPKANGVSVVQMLRESTTLNVRETPNPTDEKEVRFRVVSPRIECGRVYIVEGSWNEEFLNQVCAFPAADHDEFVDILGYAINDLYADDDDTDYDSLNIF
jgi:predicted phage terminase large subunit-like protein